MYLVSSCLAGVNCRYNGSNNCNKIIEKLVIDGKAIPICPEVISGLNIPRECCEMIIDENGNKKIISKSGEDLSDYFIEGAEKTLEICKIIGIKTAILQSRSPSCGYGLIYDGTFRGNLIEGNGLTADLLSKNGIMVYTENDLNDLL